VREHLFANFENTRSAPWVLSVALWLEDLPWTGSPCSPDFLSSSLALTNFMRLSLMKAAHASVGGAPCRKSGPWAEKGAAQPFNALATRAKDCRPRARVLAPGVKAFEEIHFRPMYAWANMGHPSRAMAQLAADSLSQDLTKQATVSISIHSYDNNEVRSAGLGNLQIACL
jgi:hypothetical protein